jgi:chromosome segregation ATPase
LGWTQDLWRLLETIVTLTKEVERVNTEVKELRRDVNALTIAVTKLNGDIDHYKTSTASALQNYQNDNDHLKESVAAKFDVLTTRLDLKLKEFENRLHQTQPHSGTRGAIKGKSKE